MFTKWTKFNKKNFHERNNITISFKGKWAKQNIMAISFSIAQSWVRVGMRMSIGVSVSTALWLRKREGLLMRRIGQNYPSIFAPHYRYHVCTQFRPYIRALIFKKWVFCVQKMSKLMIMIMRSYNSMDNF